MLLGAFFIGVSNCLCVLVLAGTALFWASPAILALLLASPAAAFLGEKESVAISKSVLFTRA